MLFLVESLGGFLVELLDEFLVESPETNRLGISRELPRNIPASIRRRIPGETWRSFCEDL